MLFSVRFTDHPDAFHVRKTFMTAHLEWLEKQRHAVKAAGSLREKNREQPVGALWVVDAETEDDVRSLFSDDPFWINGLRASVEILSWSLAFEDMLSNGNRA